MTDFSFARPYVGRKRSPFNCEGESMSVQSSKDECDINKIMAKYRKTGVLPHLNPAQPQYVDTTVMVDYQSALQTVADAQEAFMALPAAVRRHYNNDPAAFLAALDDPSQRKVFEENGLLQPKEAPQSAQAKPEESSEEPPAVAPPEA
jgi:phage internal scaffolding protein